MTEHVWRRDRSNERPEARRRNWKDWMCAVCGLKTTHATGDHPASKEASLRGQGIRVPTCDETVISKVQES
ncbi:MAG: hypothetical protein BWY99_02117 [Synergistetes bacterium ADurb.BinA166]|nr:MAG: hypothetical protein BWY99_02117 [Synergistetes bacterium ADurb.BinA166]